MEYIHVDKVYKLIENGATEPLDASLNNGNRAIIKTFNNVEGNLTLVNEYICYKLCSLLSIPIPNAGIGIIDCNTLDESTSELIVPQKYGPCFYSERINKVAPVNAAIVDRIVNKEDFYKIVLFDHLIYNKDRNRGNIIIQTGKTIYMYAIDHSHVFKNECIWNRVCFEQGIKSNDFLDYDIMDCNQELYDIFWQNMSKNKDKLLNIANDFTLKINYNILHKITSELPTEWNVPSQDLNALVKYILYRLEHINEICDIIVRR